MISQGGSSLLKSCARRSFSFMCGNLQAFATHPHSFADPLLGRNPWFEKHCFKQYTILLRKEGGEETNLLAILQIQFCVLFHH